MTQTGAEAPIPGTTLFDGSAAARGYALNAMCYSFNDAAMVLHGSEVKAGDFIMLAYGSANRDERMFPNPDVYDISRRPKRHLGFGGGVHSCLGAMLARLACQITFEEFLRVVPEFSRMDEKLSWVSSSNFRSPTVLRLARG